MVKKLQSNRIYKNNWEIIPGIIPVIFSAPHAAPQTRGGERKPCDEFTGEIVRKLCEKTGAYGIVRIENRDDDPDTENRLKIIDQLTETLQKDNSMKDKLYVIPERYFAIKFATQIAKPGDIVMLAGKGHEPIQWTNYGTRKRNDKEILTKILKNKK